MEYADSPVHRDLVFLMDELWTLESRLGDLAAYHDFAFLMEHITQDSRVRAQPSGYSR